MVGIGVTVRGAGDRGTNCVARVQRVFDRCPNLWCSHRRCYVDVDDRFGEAVKVGAGSLMFGETARWSF